VVVWLQSVATESIEVLVGHIPHISDKHQTRLDLPPHIDNRDNFDRNTLQARSNALSDPTLRRELVHTAMGQSVVWNALGLACYVVVCNRPIVASLLGLYQHDTEDTDCRLILSKIQTNNTCEIRDYTHSDAEHS